MCCLSSCYLESIVLITAACRQGNRACSSSRWGWQSLMCKWDEKQKINITLARCTNFIHYYWAIKQTLDSHWFYGLLPLPRVVYALNQWWEISVSHVVFSHIALDVKSYLSLWIWEQAPCGEARPHCPCQDSSLKQVWTSVRCWNIAPSLWIGWCFPLSSFSPRSEQSQEEGHACAPLTLYSGIRK